MILSFLQEKRILAIYKKFSLIKSFFLNFGEKINSFAERPNRRSERTKFEKGGRLLVNRAQLHKPPKIYFELFKSSFFLDREKRGKILKWRENLEKF